MKTAIIAWGSVVWKPGDLPFNDHDNEWHKDGPELPLEFSRISKDARLTLVLETSIGTTLPTLHRKSSRCCLMDTAADLREREGTVFKHIGYVTTDGKTSSATKYPDQPDVFDAVKGWLSKVKNYDAAVWTALPQNFADQLGKSFNNELASEYLCKLPKAVSTHAFDYIKRSPEQIKTAFRLFMLEKHPDKFKAKK